MSMLRIFAFAAFLLFVNFVPGQASAAPNDPCKCQAFPCQLPPQCQQNQPAPAPAPAPQPPNQNVPFNNAGDPVPNPNAAFAWKPDPNAGPAPAAAPNPAAQAAAADCDPDIMNAMVAQAQEGFNNMSLLATQMIRPPRASLTNTCVQMINSIWNPIRFVEEAKMLAATKAADFLSNLFASFTGFNLGSISFSLSFNPSTLFVKNMLDGWLKKLSPNYLCQSAYNEIGKSLRKLDYTYNSQFGTIKINAGQAVESKLLSFVSMFGNGEWTTPAPQWSVPAAMKGQIAE